MKSSRKCSPHELKQRVAGDGSCQNEASMIRLMGADGVPREMIVHKKNFMINWNAKKRERQLCQNDPNESIPSASLCKYRKRNYTNFLDVTGMVKYPGQ